MHPTICECMSPFEFDNSIAKGMLNLGHWLFLDEGRSADAKHDLTGAVLFSHVAILR